MLYTKSELKKALFFEIATKSNPFEKLSKSEKEIWENHFHPRYNKNNELEVSETYEKHAQFIPEFGRIVSLTMGVVNDDMSINIVSTDSKKEKDVLQEVSDALNGYSNLTAAGYNLANYTIPYLIKRMLINRVKLPFHLQLRGKKPWEINMIDVMKDYQGTTFEQLRLEVLANAFGVNYTSYDETNPTESCERYLKTVIECAIAMSI